MNYSNLRNYLADRKVLIVDSNAISRASLARMLLGLGSKPFNLLQVVDYEEAALLIERERPDMVITEYTIKKGNGLDLAHEFNKIKNSHSLFVVITANAMQSTVAQAAEEDVDIYLLKPHTYTYFINTLNRAVTSKMNPSEYIKKINRGKKLLEEESWDHAIEWFNHVIKVSPAPSLAYFYRSQAELQKLLYDLAETSLKNGLTHNGVHYKCLTALFDLFLKRGKLKDAYEMVKKLMHFPINHKRLSKVVELAIRTAHYSDIGKYYEVANEIEVKDQELMKHVSAALVVSGKMLFQRGEMFKAASYLKKASMSAGMRSNIQLEIITTLAMNGFIPNAKEVLRKIPKEMRNEAQFKIAESMIAYFENRHSSQHLDLLQKIIEEGTNEPIYYYWLIAFLHAEKNQSQAEDYLAKAIAQWPEKAEYFHRAAKAIASNSKPLNEVR
jgi:CheY-like chemotaxis protein